MNDPRRFDDLLAEFGPITLRRFFGGEGIYAGSTMTGSIFRDVAYRARRLAPRAASRPRKKF